MEEFWYHGMSEPICTTSTWMKKWNGDTNRSNNSYSRTKNPNFDFLQKKLNNIYDCSHSCLFSSGISAISSIFYTNVSQDSLYIVGNEMYCDTYRILDHLKQKFPGFEYIIVDVKDDGGLMDCYLKCEDGINLMNFESCCNT